MGRTLTIRETIQYEYGRYQPHSNNLVFYIPDVCFVAATAKCLLCQTFLYFESIPILRLLVPGNFSRHKIGSEGCAQKFNTNGARLQ